MVKLVQRLFGRRGSVEFCEACGQVCTAQCRSQAYRDRMRAKAMHVPFGY
jgi:hypothetical protein